MIACGAWHSLTIDRENKVWCSGSNHVGHLGVGSFECQLVPVQVPDVPNIAKLATFGNFSVLLDFDGGVWVTGSNSYSQLGMPIPNCSTVFVQVPNIPEIQLIACGSDHTVLLDYYGNLWGCGNNEHCQLGEVDQSELKRKEQFTKLKVPPELGRIESINCGNCCTVLVNAEKQLWGAGLAEKGQLGTREITDLETFQPLEIFEHGVKAISLGAAHTTVLDETGSIWETGLNEFGELGLGHRNSINEFTRVPSLPEITTLPVTGFYHSAVIDVEGGVWVYGRNSGGQLGLDHYNDSDKPQKVPEIPKMVQVATGYTHTLLVDEHGQVWGSGGNHGGQLGFSNKDTQTCYFKPVDDFQCHLEQQFQRLVKKAIHCQ